MDLRLVYKGSEVGNSRGLLSSSWEVFVVWKATDSRGDNKNGVISAQLGLVEVVHISQRYRDRFRVQGRYSGSLNEVLMGGEHLQDTQSISNRADDICTLIQETQGF